MPKEKITSIQKKQCVGEVRPLLLEVLKERLADFSGHDLFVGWYMILYHIPF